MLPPSSPDDLTRRVRRYWVEDGLAETVIGLGFLLIATVIALGVCFPAPFWGAVKGAVIILTVVGGRWVIQRLKWRITYPRTGYVAYPRRHTTRQRWLTATAIILSLIALFVGIALLSHRQGLAYLVSLTLFLALLYFGLARAQDWSRGMFYAAAALPLGGLAILLLPHPLWGKIALQGGVHLGGMGLMQILGGMITLRRYLQRHPEPLEGAP